MFIHIPKTGGTSICERFLNGDEVTHRKLTTYPRALWKRSFAVIRNPYERLTSVYNYAKMVKSHWHSNDQTTAYSLHPLYKYCNQHTLKEFITDLFNKRFSDDQLVHLREQSWYLITPGNKILTNIIRFESINRDLSALFGETIELPLTNQSLKETHIFDDEMVAMIKQIYKNDFFYFGPFEVPTIENHILAEDTVDQLLDGLVQELENDFEEETDMQGQKSRKKYISNIQMSRGIVYIATLAIIGIVAFFYWRKVSQQREKFEEEETTAVISDLRNTIDDILERPTADLDQGKSEKEDDGKNDTEQAEDSEDEDYYLLNST